MTVIEVFADGTERTTSISDTSDIMAIVNMAAFWNKGLPQGGVPCVEIKILMEVNGHDGE